MATLINTAAELGNNGLTQFDPKQLEGRLSSKSDWYKYLVYHKGYYLPSYRRTTMRFVKDFLAGDKELFKTSEIQRINVPNFRELSVKRILEEVKGDDEVLRYLNYYEDEKKLPERQFLFGVLGTLHPKYLSDLVRSQNRARNKDDGQKKPENLIRVRADILRRLSNEPFYSKQRGRALSILKSGSKPRKDINKKRKLHDLGVKFAQLLNPTDDSPHRMDMGSGGLVSNPAKRRHLNPEAKE